MTLSLTSGVEPASRLEELVALWRTLNADHLVNAVGTIPSVALKSLVSLFETWLRLSAGHAKGNFEVPTDIRTIAAGGAWRILDDLYPHIRTDPGCALLVEKSLNLGTRWQIDIPDWVRRPDVDRDLQLLASVRDFEATAEEWMARRQAEAEELGDRLLSLGPAAGAARFQQLLTDAADQANGGWATALRIADSTQELPEWIDAALAIAEPMLLGPLLGRAVSSGTPFDADAAVTALGEQRLRSTIVGAAVHATTVSDFVRRVIDELVDADAANMENLYSKKQPDEVLLALLEHPVATIRHAAALLFDVGTGHGPPLPDEWRELWRTALVEPDPTHLTQHSEWRLQEILKALATRDPDTCAAWFEARIEDPGATNRFIRDEDLRDVLTPLPRTTRAQLARKVASTYSNRRTFLPALINGDPSLLKELIDDGTLDQQTATEALEGPSRPHSAVIAEALLRVGATPDDVASALFRQDSWWGEESDHYAAQINELERMAADHPLLEPVTAIAISRLTTRREEALIRERRQRITGNFE
jgi:hypothetical protein